MPVEVYSTPGVDVSPLAQPLAFNFSKKTAKNRFLKAAMAEWLSSWSATDHQARGIPSPELIELYRRWGEEKNGFGVILTGNIAIDYGMPGGAGDAMITPEDAFYGKRFEAFQKLAAAAKANGSLVVGQVSHPGRQASEKLVKEPISASAVPLEPKMGMTFAKPRAATKADIARVIAGFAHAAQYLERAGFDGIELHGAHGYLLAQFLSRRTNQRTDEYGGSLRNRVRLIAEVAQEIRRRTSPDFILSIKLNSVEFQEGGLTPEEARDLCLILQEEVGFDFIELSGGTYEEMGMTWEKESTRRREAFFIEFAETIVPAMGKDRQTRIYITGGLRSAGAMVKALDVVDGVGLGKPSTGNPALAADILEGRVTGAIKPVAPYDNDGGVGLVASGVQIRQLSKGLEPFDLSDAKAVEAFGAAMQPWYMANLQDVEGTRSGYFDLDLPLRKYEESRL